MKKLIYLSVISFALLFVACEEKTEYIKKSYINEDAVIDGIKDPMRNIPWLEKLQREYDNADERTDKSKALILYTAYGDSVERIFNYEYYFYYGNYSSVSIGYIYNLDGKTHFGDKYPMFSSLSNTTSDMIINLIDEKINQNNKQKDFSFLSKTPPWPVPPPIYQEIDTILNNATNIEVLSCFKMVEVIK